MNPVIGVHTHSSELEHHERLAALSHALLPEKYGPSRRQFDKSGDKKEQWRERDQERHAADDIQRSLQGDLDNFLRLPVFSSDFEKNTRGSFAVWGIDLRVDRATLDLLPCKAAHQIFANGLSSLLRIVVGHRSNEAK